MGKRATFFGETHYLDNRAQESQLVNGVTK